MVAEPNRASPRSRVEFEQLASLLVRYSDVQLDQWEAWRVATSYGPVFIDISRELPPLHQQSTYRPIWPLTDDDAR